jgi:type IV pilus assembly protein PilV
MSLSLSSLAHRQRGVGLIEVLIAVLVFALGVLGMASMQVGAKRTSYDALQRSLATSLARDIVERMRSNPSATSLEIFGAVDNLGGGTRTKPKDCKANTCTPTELANYDVWEWEQALDGAAEQSGDANAGGLVSPKACITHNAGVVTVAIAWKGYAGQVNPTGSTCGETLGLYGTGEVDRQLVLITTYIEEV